MIDIRGALLRRAQRAAIGAVVLPIVMLLNACGAGGGTSPTPGGGGSLVGTLSTSSTVSFGSVSVGSNKSAELVLKNTGNADVQVSSIQLNGSGFSWTGSSLPFTIAAGGTVSLGLVFEPAGSGSATGTVVIGSNASNSTVSVSLSGTGLQSSVQHSVTLNWANGSTSLQGYYVYRGGQTGGPYARISPLQATSSYVDSSVGGGMTYYYVVTALGTNAVESSYSNEVKAVIPQ